MQKSTKKSGATFVEEHFGVREYIETYYPNHHKLKELITIATLLQSAYRTSTTVKLQDISGNVDLEMVENIAIFDFHRQAVEILSKFFPRGDAVVLDVGAGPTIYQHIMLSLISDYIVHSEFLEKNRREVTRWLRKEEGAYEWDIYFKLVKDILKKDEMFMHEIKQGVRDPDRKISVHAKTIQTLLRAASVDLLKHRVRKSVGTKVVRGDVFKADLDLPKNIPSSFDIVTASFVVEGTTGSRTKYLQGMKNVLKHVTPGGFFVHASVRNASWYKVGSERVVAVPVTEKDIKDVCTSHGFTILTQRLLRGSDKRTVGYDGMIFTLARKDA
jgi:nicotinamide N-methyltransferase